MRKHLPFLPAFLILMLAVSSCKTSSDLADDSLLKKRRYTSGYALNIKAPQFLKNKEIHRATPGEPERQMPVLDATEHNVTQHVQPEIAQISPALASADFTQPDFPQHRLVAGDEPWKAAVRKNPANVSMNANADSRTGLAAPSMEAPNVFERGKAVVGAPVAVQSAESMVLYIILAILIPPLAVGLLYGIGTEFWISLVLTLLFIVPGIVYALIMVLQY